MKICISRIDRMGDMILTLPIIKSIKTSNPKSEIHVISSNRNKKILESFKYVDKIILFDEKKHSLRSIIKNLRKLQYNYFFNFSPGWKSFFICLFSKTQKKANLILLSRYKKKIFSKTVIIFLSKIFFYQYFIVDRLKRLSKNLSIHQTQMMFKVLEISKIPHKKDIEIEKFLPQLIKLNSAKKICLVHLSSKWINDEYNEEDFINLVLKLEKKFQIILTSDTSTEDRFSLIFKKFLTIEEQNFKNFDIIEETTILNNFKFLNWVQAIYSANLVITPECGCTHIASICNIPTKIIYDPKNMPDAIQKEYAPLKNNYQKFVFGEENLNKKLASTL